MSLEPDVRLVSACTVIPVGVLARRLCLTAPLTFCLQLDSFRVSFVSVLSFCFYYYYYYYHPGSCESPQTESRIHLGINYWNFTARTS